MRRYESLIQYLQASKKGGFGWVPAYEKTITGNQAILAGHYHGILQDLIDCGGIEQLLAVVYAAQHLHQRGMDLSAMTTTHLEGKSK